MVKVAVYGVVTQGFTDKEEIQEIHQKMFHLLG
jgi:hypothetical protein